LTSVGKILLADKNEATLEWIYSKNKKMIKKNHDEFMAEIKDVAENGYALDDEDFSAGLRCVAAPIKAFGGATVMAMSVSTPLARMDNDRYLKTRELVVECAKKASIAVMELEETLEKIRR
jgi:DNA-binding IclR family transcriptional regulator